MPKSLYIVDAFTEQPFSGKTGVRLSGVRGYLICQAKPVVKGELYA